MSPNHVTVTLTQVALCRIAKNVLAEFTAKVSSGVQTRHQRRSPFIYMADFRRTENKLKIGALQHKSTSKRQCAHLGILSHPPTERVHLPPRINGPSCQISTHLKKKEVKCGCIHASSPLPLLLPQSLQKLRLY